MTDFHCHCLPGIDDGAKDAGEGLQIAARLREQGIGRIVATPHYIHHRDNIDAFLARRAGAAAAFQEAAAQAKRSLPSILPGAEVRLEKNLSEVEGLDRLRMGNSRYILLELPFIPYKEWMGEEIDNIAYRYSLTPIIAHLDRYEWYTKDEVKGLTERPDTVIQFNCSAFQERRYLKLILQLIREGRPVVVGSDAHNMGERAPRFDTALKALRGKLKDGEFTRFEQEGDRLL